MSSIGRALLYEGWSKKKAKQGASEQNTDLQEAYFDKILHFHPDQFVFVDESRCDKQIGIRRTGWSPCGITPVQVTKFHQGQRYHILPAYAQDSMILPCTCSPNMAIQCPGPKMKSWCMLLRCARNWKAHKSMHISMQKEYGLESHSQMNNLPNLMHRTPRGALDYTTWSYFLDY